MALLSLFRTVSQRTQILCDRSFPQRGSTEEEVTIAARHIEFQEGPSSARALKQAEFVPTVLDIIK
jgi:hypothetical protein